MNLILNLLWLFFGGFVAALAWFGVAILCALSLIGLPWARAAANIGFFTLWPFGQTAIARNELTGRQDIGTSEFGTLGNLIWLVLAGWWLALGHLAAAAVLAVTIIGIPFAWQHLKLAGMALWPIGMAIVPLGVADAARRTHDWREAMDWRR
ncbi:MAG: hypothetical protein QOJ54_2254 [Aliidongia sp.]|jgi:uncharacterized membrane protein YccF (DUF307 family)|nr:hypothetical protein [Aliidongia sp.]